MSVTGFIPKVWSASILRGFEKVSVFAGVLSREYAGEIQNVGDTVKVPMIGAVAVRDYQKRVPIQYDDVSGSTLDITIDQAKYFGLRTEDIEKLQSAPDFLDGATKNAAYAIANTVDKYSAEILANGAGTKLYEDEPFPLNLPTFKNNDDVVISLFTELAKNLDELNVPRADRYCIIPPSLVEALSLSVIKAGTPNETPISEGFIFRCAGFNILMSNNLPTDTDGNITVIAGTRSAATHIMQLEKIETLRDTEQFGDLVRGLAVYTSKVLLPEGIVTALVKKPVPVIK